MSIYSWLSHVDVFSFLLFPDALSLLLLIHFQPRDVFLTLFMIGSYIFYPVKLIMLTLNNWCKPRADTIFSFSFDQTPLLWPPHWRDVYILQVFHWHVWVLRISVLLVITDCCASTGIMKPAYNHYLRIYRCNDWCKNDDDENSNSIYYRCKYDNKRVMAIAVTAQHDVTPHDNIQSVYSKIEIANKLCRNKLAVTKLE